MRTSKLMTAIAKGNPAEVAEALQAESARASRLRTFFAAREPTPLLLAVDLGHAHIAELLLDAGAELDGDTPDWNTPLAVACRRGDRASVELLLARGADIERARPGHANALEEAAYCGREDLVELLLRHGGDASRVLSGAAESLLRIQPSILARLTSAVDTVPVEVQSLLTMVDRALDNRATPLRCSIRESLELLRALGWQVRPRSTPLALPATISLRYPWLSPQVREVAEGFEQVCNVDDTAWLLLVSDYAGSTPSAYAWNEWERLSLTAASGDPAWQGRIRAFWDAHFPILTSVKSGYAYFAVQRDSGALVVGEEPEFEETSPIAGDYRELLSKLTMRDPSLLRWL